MDYADDSSDCDNDCSESDVEDPTKRYTSGIATVPAPCTNPPLSLENIVILMQQSNYNWFEFHQKMVAEMDDNEDHSDIFSEFLCRLLNLSFSEHE